MSGFAGIFDAERDAAIEPVALEAMDGAIAHRSRVERSIHVEAGYGLASRGGSFVSSDGTMRVALDGALVNRDSLRDRLVALGHEIGSSGDAELVLAAYRQWAADCVHQFRGPFAFAVWNATDRELVLARDHSGVKPLYVAIGSTRTVFASEAKALLTNPGLRRGIDLLGYLGGVDFDAHLRKSPFLGVSELSPGCTLRCTATKRSTSRYWSWAPSEDAGRFNPMTVVGEFAGLLHEAVGLNLAADEPVGLCFSGGVDSASIAASMVAHGRRDVVTYTFESEGDESRDGFAGQVAAEFLKLENRKVKRPSADFPGDDEIVRLAWESEGEFSLAFLERRALAEAARADGVGVLLHGQGIDEVLGATWATYHAFRNAALVRHLRSEVVPSPRGWPRFAPEVIGAVGQDLSGWMGRRQEAWWAGLMSKELGRDHGRLASGMLRFEDRMSAAAGIDARAPLLDHVFLTFLASLPEGSRLELFTSKRILRAAAARVVPRNIAGRPRAVSPAWGSAMAPRVLERGGNAAALLSRERVEENGWFAWKDVEAMRSAGDFESLDHVLILHLLEEVFIRDFRVGR